MAIGHKKQTTGTKLERIFFAGFIFTYVQKIFLAPLGGGAIALIAPYLTTLKRALLWKEAPMPKISSIRSAVSTELRLVTDGQTWRAMAYNALV